jgi:hypothetical protein
MAVTNHEVVICRCGQWNRFTPHINKSARLVCAKCGQTIFSGSYNSGPTIKGRPVAFFENARPSIDRTRLRELFRGLIVAALAIGALALINSPVKAPKTAAVSHKPSQTAMPQHDPIVPADSSPQSLPHLPPAGEPTNNTIAHPTQVRRDVPGTPEIGVDHVTPPAVSQKPIQTVEPQRDPLEPVDSSPQSPPHPPPVAEPRKSTMEEATQVQGESSTNKADGAVYAAVAAPVRGETKELSTAPQFAQADAVDKSKLEFVFPAPGCPDKLPTYRSVASICKGLSGKSCDSNTYCSWSKPWNGKDGREFAGQCYPKQGAHVPAPLPTPLEEAEMAKRGFPWIYLNAEVALTVDQATRLERATKFGQVGQFQRAIQEYTTLLQERVRNGPSCSSCER